MTRLFEIVGIRMIVFLVLGVGAVMATGMRLLLRDPGVLTPGQVWGITIGVPAAAALIALLVTVVVMRPWVYTQDMADMRAGHAWAHWRYDEREWRAANRVEGRRTRRSSYTAALFALGLGLVITVIGLATGSEVTLFAGAVTGGASLIMIGVIAGASPVTLARSRPTGEIYISPLGVYRRPGGYVALAGFGVRLRAVELVPGDPPYLRFETLVAGRAGQTNERMADVAVPAGREDEARRLVERFRGRD